MRVDFSGSVRLTDGLLCAGPGDPIGKPSACARESHAHQLAGPQTPRRMPSGQGPASDRQQTPECRILAEW